MTSMPEQNACAKCPKGGAQIVCVGCQQWFCFKHLVEHRQELNIELDQVIQARDDLQHDLNGNEYEKHPLFARIKIWETKSMERIQQAADEIRHNLQQYFQQRASKVKSSLGTVSEQMRSGRQTGDYTEIHLEKWTIQLAKLRSKLETTSDLDLNHDRAEMLESIQIITLKQKRRKTLGPLSYSDSIPRATPDTTERWPEDGITVGGFDQLTSPYGFDIDGQGTIFVADRFNHRIMAWRPDSTRGEIVAGGNEPGDRIDQLNEPIAVIVDRKSNTLLVSDWQNHRIVRWLIDSQRGAEVVVAGVTSLGLAIDHQGFLYVSDYEKREVRRYCSDDPLGTVVAGGHGPGSGLHQLHGPRNIFVDDEQSVYVSDSNNDRVMKWLKDQKQGIVVAGGQGRGNELRQLNSPSGLFVDSQRAIYVVDQQNHRIMRWSSEARQGEIIVGLHGRGSQPNQLSAPATLLLDRQGNLYVADMANHRIQKFTID